MLLTRLINAPIQIQRAIAFGLAVLLILAMCFVIWTIVSSVSSRQLALFELRERAGKLTKIANMKAGLQRPVAEGNTGAKEPLFQEAESLTIGRANLQSRIDAIAQGNSLVLDSAGSVPDIDKESIKLIGIRVDVAGSYEAIHKAIADIETSKPPLLVRELSLRLTSGEAGDRPVELAAQIKIFGAFRLTATNLVDAPVDKAKTP